jgi:hypothetical protein
MATQAQIDAIERDRLAAIAYQEQQAARAKVLADNLAAIEARRAAAIKASESKSATGSAKSTGPTYGRVSDANIPLDIVDTIEQPVDLPPETRSNGLLIVGAVLAGLYLLAKVK